MLKKYLLPVLAVVVLAGCAQVGALALKLMTSKEKDLTKMAVVGMYQNNLYPKSVNTMSTNFAKEWQDGATLVGVRFIKTEGYGVLALDGTVLIDGDTAVYQSGGVYTKFLEKPDGKAHKIEIHSASGQKSSFEIAPAPSFKLKAINGKTSDFEVDITKDLVLEFELSPQAKGKLMSVSMISSMPGGRDFNEIQPFYAAPKVTIPAGSFKSTQISGAGLTGKDVVKFVNENQWLKVVLIEENRLTVEPHPYARNKSQYLQTVQVSLKGEIESHSVYRTSGEIAVKDEKPYKYEGTVANGYWAASLEAKKLRIGMASLGISATLFKQTKDVSESELLDGTRVITTTITTYQFPQLDDVYWDTYMKGIYDAFKQILQKYNVEVVDIEQVIADPNYEKFYAVEDKNTKEVFRKNYKKSKRISSFGLTEIGEQTATAGITDDLPKPKLLQSLNLDAIAYVNLNFRIGGDANAVVLYPQAGFGIEGRSILDKATVQNWYLVNGYRGKGVPFSEKEFTNVEALNRILQKEMIVASFEKAIAELVEKQRAAQVAECWNLIIENQ